MSPLVRGNDFRAFKTNLDELMNGEIGPARKKAIKTIAKKNGITFEEARFQQAKTITLSQTKKK